MSRLHQGSFDGFCGLYAIAHLVGFRNPENYDDIASSVFHHLLRALEHGGRLTAAKIAGPNRGFTDLMIADAFNSMSAKSRRGLMASSFRKLAFVNSEFIRNPKRIFEAGGGLVIKQHGGSHWLAVTGMSSEGQYICFDPSISDPSESRGRIAWDEGIMVGPLNIIENL